MILPALIDYYRRLENDPDESVASLGFSREKIHFAIVLNSDGTLRGDYLDDIREEVIENPRTGITRLVPSQMILPYRGDRSGKMIFPYFLWDNTGYVLGRDDKGKPKRAEQMFAAFVDFHLSLENQIEDEDYRAVCQFLRSWSPNRTESLANWEEACGQNVVFRVHRPNQHRFVHQSDNVQQVWLSFREESEHEPERGISLISGQTEDLARVHPKIQGVAGTNTMGAAIVSFNEDAYLSFGKSQSYNAPVGTDDAFRYTTALNHLLSDSRHRLRIGDSTVVFWADSPVAFEGMFGHVVSERAEDDATRGQVQGFFKALRSGREHGGVENGEVGFHVLGLSPNASRISIRYWLTGTVSQFANHLAQHLQDLEMVGAPADGPPLAIRRLLIETAREPKEIPPQLAGELTRAVLTGGPYPQAMFLAVLRRIQADRVVNHRRAAILKACLVRRARISQHPKELPVSLNIEHPEPAYQPAYHLGRLFAALEKTQEEGFEKTNQAGKGEQKRKTIRDSYYGSASSTPSSVFPRLMRLHQHHLAKVKYDGNEETKYREGQRVNLEKLIQEICSHISDRFPPHLNLDQQGMFHIGYYHQRRAFSPESE